MNIYQSLELPANIAGADTPIQMEDMVLSGKFVDDRQHLQPTSPDRSIVDEIPGPFPDISLHIVQAPQALGG